MDNNSFLECIAKSFIVSLETHSRSNAKLKILHGAIAEHLNYELGDNFSVNSLGFAEGKEGKIQGRYINKNVDITIYDKNSRAIAGIGVKFVMQNYSQNSNNYFENMLGETANIRSCNIPYFQIFVIPDKIPYYKDNGTIQNWETFTQRNVHKYQILSMDKIDIFVHTPNKTLLYVVELPEIPNEIEDKFNYKQYYLSLPNFSLRETTLDYYGKFDSSVIFNDYASFIEKIVHYIKFL